MTSGYDVTKVLAAMHSRIGWKQPVAAGSPTLTSANTTSKSGRYFNDGSFHSLVTVDNVKKTMEEAAASDSNLNTKLSELTNAAIMRCLSAVFRERETIEQVVVMNPLPNQQVRTMPNSTLFVGLEINIARAVDVLIQLNTLQLLFDAATTFNLYVFAEGKKDPITTIDTVASAAGQVAVITLDEKFLQYISTSYQASRFWIGYFQQDIVPAKAIQQDVSFAKTKMFGVQPMQAPRNGSENDFVRDQISYSAQLQGLNLEISAFKDHTNQIIRNASVFDEAVGLTVAQMVAEQTIYSTQSNATERILKDQMTQAGIMMDINGAAPVSDSPKIKGLNARIEQELARVRLSFYPKPKAQVVNYALC